MIDLEKRLMLILCDKPALRSDLLGLTNGQWEALFSDNTLVDIISTILPMADRVTPTWILTNFPYVDFAVRQEFDDIDRDDYKSFADYVDLLRRAMKVRQVQLLATTIQTIDTTNVDAKLLDVAKSATELSLSHLESFDPSATAIATRIANRRAKDHLGFRVPAGVGLIDQAMGGLHLPGPEGFGAAFWAIIGSEKSGKTTLARNVVNAALDSDVGVSWVHTERADTSEDVFADIVALRASRDSLITGQFRGIHHDVVIYGGGVAETTDLIGRAIADITKRRLRIYSTGLRDGNTLNLPGIVKYVQADVQLRGHKLVIVDNLHGWRTSEEDDYRLMLRTVPAWAELVARFGTTIIVLSQQNREGDVRGGGGLQGEVTALFRITSHKEDLPNIDLELAYSRRRAYAASQIKIDSVSGLIMEEM